MSQFSVELHSRQLKALAREGIWLGTSSWKYEGWIGQVYHRSYAGKRQGFVKAQFDKHALEEFAEVFPTVCYDGAYWNFPTFEQLEGFASQVPENFRMTLKATNQITQRKLQDGSVNPSYLDPAVFNERLLEPASKALGEKLGPIVLEFSPIYFANRRDGYRPLDFVKELHKFLSQVPKNVVKLAVEVRDPEFLHPQFTRYLDCLRYHNVAHVINDQTWMPPILEQLSLPGIFTASFSVVRALVQPGTSYQDSVEFFEPFNQTRITLPLLRKGMVEIIRACRTSGIELFGYIGNREEGNSPNTVAGILDLLNEVEKGN